MEQFETIDINKNICIFQYEYDEIDKDDLDRSIIEFKIYSIPADPFKWFLYRFLLLDENTAKGEMMDANNNDEFRKKGIPEQIIQIASKTLKEILFQVHLIQNLVII